MITHKNYRYKFGVTRNVFLIFNYAIKIPSISEWRLFLLGLLANMQEVAFSKTKHYKLCPIVFYVPFGFLVVMKRCRELTDDEFDIAFFEKWVNDEEFLLPCELKSDSFGYLDDKIVVFDYGN